MIWRGQRILGMTNVILCMTYVMTGLSQKIAFAPNLSLLPVMHTSYRPRRDLYDRRPVK